LKDSINFQDLKIQESEPLQQFSFLKKQINSNKLISCYETKTNQETAKIIKENFSELPMGMLKN
jgi:tRNA U34 5-carboxymethylaminomethyl modifying enzyme MnmG/GidA